VQILKDYGERGAMQVVPRKNLLLAGVMSTEEIDRPIGYTDLSYFSVIHSGMTRKDHKSGQIVAPSMVMDRESMLKVATIWGAYYGKVENKAGSLEPGKWADLIVLDRDYLTIPVDDIAKIRVLMTMTGGKIIHLVPSFAREIGMP